MFQPIQETNTLTTIVQMTLKPLTNLWTCRSIYGNLLAPKKGTTKEQLSTQKLCKILPSMSKNFYISCSKVPVHDPSRAIYNDQTAEVTLKYGGLVRASLQNPLNSGLGIILICPGNWWKLHVPQSPTHQLIFLLHTVFFVAFSGDMGDTGPPLQHTNAWKCLEFEPPNLHSACDELSTRDIGGAIMVGRGDVFSVPKWGAIWPSKSRGSYDSTVQFFGILRIVVRSP